MTTPIGSGKNARYGYEEEDLFCGEESKTCSNENPPVQEPLCATRADAGSAPDAPPKADVEKAEPCDVLPDYGTFSASAGLIFHATVSATVDRYGHVYTAGGGGLGTPGLGASAMAGYLRDPDHLCEPPTEELLGKFLVGEARSFGGGAGIGVGAVRSSEMWATEVGATTPQLGVTYAVGGRHPEWEKK
ncbi:MAG TPA: hypothetical protein VK550_29980 [Polyangiaceae bacterium]|nr:hypothetical protein [Polyangiaceae bacterium]